MRLTTSRMPPNFPTQRRRLLTALWGDLLVLLAILLLATSDSPDFRPSIEVRPAIRPPQAAGAALTQQEAMAVRLGSMEASVRAAIAGSEAQVGVTLLDGEGTPLLSINAEEPFVLASVSKVYLLVAYLSLQYEEEVKISDADMELLQPMIRVSDNDSATAIWKKIGREEGLAAFLESKGLAPVGQTEEHSWGTLLASPAQVAELLQRLASGQLLDAESTQLAMSLLSDIHEEQSWGVSAGADTPGARIFLKNGWYPEEEGWRVNSAGTVQGPGQRYVLVVFSYPDESFDQGIALVEEVASRVNAFMGR